MNVAGRQATISFDMQVMQNAVVQLIQDILYRFLFKSNSSGQSKCSGIATLPTDTYILLVANARQTPVLNSLNSFSLNKLMLFHAQFIKNYNNWGHIFLMSLLHHLECELSFHGMGWKWSIVFCVSGRTGQAWTSPARPAQMGCGKVLGWL